MVKVAPLEGITYNLGVVEIDKVIAPPYDVISEEEQEELYNLSQYNIIRLILGKTKLSDDNSNNRYTRAAESFNAWLDEKALVKADKPSIYYYIQSYKAPNGELVTRKGFIAKNRLEEYSSGKVMPHEYTMGGPKEDRLKLTKACKANFSQIFMLYSDPENQIDKAFKLPEKAFIDVADKQGVRNTVYIIDDQDVINKVTELMKDKSVLIADGHHRYETALAYREYMRSENKNYKEDDASNWVMCYYTNLDDKNLKVYPTHRIITRPVDSAKLLEELKKYFKITEYTSKEKFNQDLENIFKSNIAFGIRFKGQDKYLLCELTAKEKVNEILAKKDVPPVLRKLDLTVLHKLIVSDILGFSEEDQMKQNGIKYIKKEEEAMESLENGTAELVFLMASPKVQDIKEVSQEGYRMPQKSTYFYPKLLSGLVINPLY